MGQNPQDKEESKLQQNNAIDFQTVIYYTKWKIFTPCIILQNIRKGRTKQKSTQSNQSKRKAPGLYTKHVL